MKILEGIRVFELGVYGQGPLTGSMLGDLGADVIKVEHPVGGDLVRLTARQWGSQRQITVDGKPFHLDIDMMNRSKRGITLDLSKPKGRETAYRLLKHCDVFLTNLRRQSVEDVWGFTYEKLRELNPRIIRLLTNGVGPEGPEAATPAFDPVGMARSGFMFAGSTDGKPVYPIGALSDLQAAEINVIAILSAIVARERFGIGQDIATSQLGSMFWFQQLNVYTTLVTGKQYVNYPRYETPLPANLPFLCQDDKWLYVNVSHARYWTPFCTAVGRQDLIDDVRYATTEAREKNNRELVLVLEDLFRRQPRAHWIRILTEADIVHAPVNQMEEAVNDPQAIINGYVMEIDHPVLGKTRTNGFPIRFSETPFKFERVAPQLGQHTDEVLQEIGLSAEEIAALRAEKVI